MLNEVVLPAYCIGENAIKDSALTLGRFGKRAMLVGGRKAFDAALGLLHDALQASGVTVAGEEWYGGECTYSNMKVLAEKARGIKADMIVGVGGGKALDTAKGCANLLDMPIVTVPTIASTCAAVTALSVVYDDEGVFVESMFHRAPPTYALIDLSIIAKAPVCYLRAGIGDAMAKHVECSLASRGRALTHSSTMAVALSQSAFDPQLKYGRDAIRDVENGGSSEAVDQVVLANVVSTGLTSLLIDEVYNGAIAHALFYGMTKIQGFEARVLHGDCVGYGVLVQEMVDGHQERFAEIRQFYRDIGIPVTVADMGYTWTDELLAQVIPATLKALKAARVMPFDLTADMLKTALLTVEKY